MRKRILTRLAAAAAGGTLALAAVGPALAFGQGDVDLGQSNLTANDDEIEQTCDDREEWADVADENWPIPDDVDAWHFVVTASGGNPDASFDTLYLEFEDDDGKTIEITFDASGATDEDGKDYVSWLRQEPEQQEGRHAYLYTPAGWTLVEGSADMDGGNPDHFRVSHTCPGTPDEDTPPTESPSPPPESPSESPEETESPGAGDEEDDEGLPVTGVGLGGLLLLAGGLIAGGVALLAVKRRRDMSELLEG